MLNDKLNDETILLLYMFTTIKYDIKTEYFQYLHRRSRDIFF